MYRHTICKNVLHVQHQPETCATLDLGDDPSHYLLSRCFRLFDYCNISYTENMLHLLIIAKYQKWVDDGF